MGIRWGSGDLLSSRFGHSAHSQDADTIAVDQQRFTEVLRNGDRSAVVLSAGRIELSQDGSMVHVDVIDLASEFAAEPTLRRRFSLALAEILGFARRVQL